MKGERECFKGGGQNIFPTLKVPRQCIYKNSGRTSQETLRLRYKAQPVNVVQGNSRCLL
jgi:hypothetical protein